MKKNFYDVTKKVTVCVENGGECDDECENQGLFAKVCKSRLEMVNQHLKFELKGNLEKKPNC